MKFLNFLKPKPAQPTIDSYGQQSCGVPQEQIQWEHVNFARTHELLNSGRINENRGRNQSLLNN
ncbi:MAG: hypothetical protein V7K64_08085, partial [Nostoc sp.]